MMQSQFKISITRQVWPRTFDRWLYLM